MQKLRAKKDGKNIIIHKDDFEYILLCLCSQKFVGEAPPCGDAMAMPADEYDKTQQGMQEVIDNCYDQCMNLIHNSTTLNARQKAFVKKYGYGG